MNIRIPTLLQDRLEPRYMAVAAAMVVVSIVIVTTTGGDDAAQRQNATAQSEAAVAQPAVNAAVAPAAGTAAVTPTGVAPLAAAAGDQAADDFHVSSDAAAVPGAPRGSTAQQVAARALETAVTGVHSCIRRADAKRRAEKSPLEVDPLQCVNEYTDGPGAADQGMVKFDVATVNGYSFYVDARDRVRYRYSEFDGKACRSADRVGGCGAW